MARGLIRCLVVLVAALWWSGAAAEPVTLITAAAALYGGHVVFAVAILVAGLYSSAQARRKQHAAQEAARAQYNAGLQDRNVTVLSNEAPRQYIYGSPAPVGGAVVAILSSGSRDEYKHMVVVFAAHESLAIDEIYIEGVPVGTLDGSGWATPGSAFYESNADTSASELITLDGAGLGTVTHVIGSLMAVSVPQGEQSYDVSAAASGTTISAPAAAGLPVYVSYTYASGTSRVNVQKHLSPGGVDTADAFLIAQVPSKWTSAHKLSGYTYAVITLDQNFGQFQGGPPNITAKGRWKKDIYDFRTATSGYSNNPALCTADFLRGIHGFSATLAQIDSVAAIAAANACDAQGFTCDGVVSTGQARDANLTMLEDSMAGNTHFSGGVWRIMVGAWTSPVLTLDDSTTLAGPIEVTQASQARESRFNAARGQYVPIAGLGVTSDFTPYRVANYVTADGFEQAQDLSMPMTGTNAQCQKLAAIAVEKARLGLTIIYPAQLAAWRVQPGDRLTVNNAELGFVAKTFRLVDWTFTPQSPLGLVLTEDNAAVYTGTFNTPDYQLATSNLADPFARPAAPANLAANSGTGVLQRFQDGTIVTRVRISWQATTVRTILLNGYTQLQWRKATVTDDQWQSLDLPADASSYYLTGPQDGASILVRVRWISGIGALGTWSTIAHQVVGKTAPPTTPGFVLASQTLVSWGAISDVDLAGYRVRAFPGATGAVWSRATPLHNDLLTTGPWPYPVKLYGVQTIMVLAEDTTGNQSAVATAVVDFGQPDLGNSVQSKDYLAAGFPGTKTNCSVVASNLVATADPASDRYALADVYGETDVYATSYLAMQYVGDSFFPAYQGGTLTLSTTIAGASPTVEYQIDGSTTNDNFALADVYAASDLYQNTGTWAAWPGALQVARMQGVAFRVSVAGGATQGAVSAMTASLVTADVRQAFGNIAIAATGTRMDPTAGAPARVWISIKTAQVTPILDGGAAVTSRVVDFSATQGPLIQLLDITGTAVAGRATVDIGGLADG